MKLKFCKFLISGGSSAGGASGGAEDIETTKSPRTFEVDVVISL